MVDNLTSMIFNCSDLSGINSYSKASEMDPHEKTPSLRLGAIQTLPLESSVLAGLIVFGQIIWKLAQSLLEASPYFQYFWADSLSPTYGPAVLPFLPWLAASHGCLMASVVSLSLSCGVNVSQAMCLESAVEIGIIRVLLLSKWFTVFTHPSRTCKITDERAMPAHALLWVSGTQQTCVL